MGQDARPTKDSSPLCGTFSQRPPDLDVLVALKDVAFLDVVVADDLHAAHHVGLDVLGIVLEAIELFEAAGVAVLADGVRVTIRTGCTPSEVPGAGPTIGADGELTADDVILFISWFTSSDARADVAGPGPTPGADGEFTADDIILFISRFTAGC